MGILDRWRHDDGDDAATTEVVDPDEAVRQYHVALRSASPAVLTAVHAEALAHLDPDDLVELRRRLDAHLSHPKAPGDASGDAVATDLGQLASTGSGAVSTLLAQGEQDGCDPPHQVDEERLASAFVSSRVWRVADGQIRPSRRTGRRNDAEALAVAELHKIRNTIGTGSSSFGGL